MVNKLFKKGVALLGGVMILLNMALPGFTYAEENSAPFQVTMSVSEVENNSVTVTAQYPEITEELINSNKWIDAEITADKTIPAGTEVTIKYTLGETSIPSVTTILEEISAGTTLSGSALMKQSTRTKLNNAHSEATEKFELTFKVPGQEQEGNVNVTVKSVLYDTAEATTGTPLGEKDFSVNIPAIIFEKVGEKNYFFTKAEAVEYFTTIVGNEKAEVWGNLLSTDKPIIALPFEIQNVGEKTDVVFTSNTKKKDGWDNGKDYADENGNLVMSGSWDTDKINGIHAFFLSPGDQIESDFTEGNFTLTMGEKTLTYTVKKPADLEWKTDFDPSKSTNPDIRDFWTARQGTPFVDIKNKDDAKLSNLLGFLYTINAPNLDLAGGNNVGYTITKGDKVIAYGALRKEQPGAGVFQWSFRDWSSSKAYTAEETKYDPDNFYHDGPGGSELDDVEGVNETILKAGDKVTILVKAKLANGEAILTQEYTITAQDVIKAQYGVEKVTLTLKDGETELGKQTVISGTAAEKPADPKKEKFTFKGWFADAQFKTAFDFATRLDKDTTIYAKWEAVQTSSSSSSSGGGSGGGSSSSPSKTSTNNSTPSQTNTQTVTSAETSKATDTKSLEALTKDFVETNKDDTSKVEKLAQALASVQKSTIAQELKDAYTYAYLRGITTQPSIEKAELQRGLTRAEMAKMMSVFATKVLNKKIVKTDTVQYADVKMEGDLPEFIQLAYQLQIMGIDAKGNAIQNFNPNAEVSRAEFATVLSRVLYGDKYNQEGVDFASKHLKALKDASVLKDTNPQMKELRGWVMLMLQRAEGVK